MAHVLFMDIVAYSQLPIDQQHKILNELQDVVRSSNTVKRAQAEDTLIALPTGDGMALVFFGSPESPAQCALELSRALREHPEIKLRMGIHNGPVYRVADINAARNVAGGGINMAQRVMDCGDAGHILVSKVVADVLAQLSTWGMVVLQDLGETEVKHGVRVHIFNLHTNDVGKPELPHKLQAAQQSAVAARARKTRIKLALSFAVVLLAGVIGGGIWYFRHATKFHEKDTIVLADFNNRTGESVWDATLKQELTRDLENSNYLNVLPDQTVSDTLKLMKRQPDERLTKEMAQDVCQRNNIKALLTASIDKLGSQYHLALQAINCQTGATLASASANSDSKEKVLAALNDASNDLRRQLGETLSSVQKYNAPLPHATTASLEAIQAYAMGLKMTAAPGPEAAVPFYKRAIELDPDFADAYAALAAAYTDLGQVTLAMQNAQKAYELRDQVSPRERFHIEGDYYLWVTGEMEKANQTYLAWIQAYPNDQRPYQNLGANYSEMGQYEKAVAEKLIVMQLQPNEVNAYAGLMGDYIALDLPDKAKGIFEEVRKRKPDDDVLGPYRYFLAFREGDTATMKKQVEWAMGKPGTEDLLLSAESDTEAFYGRFDRARDFTQRAAQSAKNADALEAAAVWQANAALREAEVGNLIQARAVAAESLAMSGGRVVQQQSALALARAGQSDQAEKIAAKLDAEFPRSTKVQNYWLPSIRAAIALQQKNAAKAIELLEVTAPYELGGGESLMYPVYLRGEAYLKLGRGHEAAGEFQKIIDHPGVVLNFVIGPLARLQLARAAAMSGDTAAARKAYEQFFALWKDADADLPVLKAAKAEYQRLK